LIKVNNNREMERNSNYFFYNSVTLS